MNITTFSPFGLTAKETGVITILANYLKRLHYDVHTLSCNGIFSLCDRDGDHTWKRDIEHCFQCMREQKELSNWADVPSKELSGYIKPQEIFDSKHWVLSLPIGQLPSARYDGFPLYDLCKGSFLNRFGSDSPALSNKANEQVVRRFLISALRMCLAIRRFLRLQRPELSFVASGADFLSRTFIHEAKQQNFPVVLLSWNRIERCVKIHHPTSKMELPCPLVFENITTIRWDNRTWAPEVVKMLDDVLAFLEISTTQISLPIAR